MACMKLLLGVSICVLICSIGFQMIFMQISMESLSSVSVYSVFSLITLEIANQYHLVVEWIRSFDGDLELQLFLKKHTPSGLTAEKEFVLKVNSLVIVQIVLVLLTITGFSLWMCNVNRNMKAAVRAFIKPDLLRCNDVRPANDQNAGCNGDKSRQKTPVGCWITVSTQTVSQYPPVVNPCISQAVVNPCISQTVVSTSSTQTVTDEPPVTKCSQQEISQAIYNDQVCDMCSYQESRMKALSDTLAKHQDYSQEYAALQKTADKLYKDNGDMCDIIDCQQGRIDALHHILARYGIHPKGRRTDDQKDR